LFCYFYHENVVKKKKTINNKYIIDKKQIFMDPNIWGPKLWNIIYDIAYMCEHYRDNHQNPPPQILQQSVRYLFESFQFLLPCIYCRQSYKIYYNKNFQGKGPPIGPGALRWTYRLKQLVNQKLGHTSIPFSEFKNRMDHWTAASCDGDVLQILFMFGKNLYTDSKEVTINCKKQWYKKMWVALIRLLKEIPSKKALADILQQQYQQQCIQNDILSSQKKWDHFLQTKLITHSLKQ
jgi:hypothetical protein